MLWDTDGAKNVLRGFYKELFGVEAMEHKNCAVEDDTVEYYLYIHI